ncbi:hypothetical protein ACWD7B_32760, partial [Streptomyces rubiginosohelvolus]
TDREELAKKWATWDGYLELGKEYKKKAPAKRGPPTHPVRVTMRHMPWTAGTVPRRPAWKSSKACFSSA